MLLSSQIKAARALLGWAQGELAEKSRRSFAYSKKNGKWTGYSKS